MLRGAIAVCAAIWFAFAAAWVFRDPGAWPMLAMASIFLLGTLYERFHYRGAPEMPGEGWEPTAERFRDDETGALVTVWFNPRTGERRYVEAREQLPPTA